MRGGFKNLGDSVKAKVPRKRGRNISEYEGDVVDRNCWENGGQNGERIVQAASTACDGAIGQEKNGSDGVYVALDLSRNTLPVELGLLGTTSVKQTRRIENSNLGIVYSCIRLPKNAATYHYPVRARKFVEAHRIGLTLIIRTTLFVGVVEDLEVVVVNVVTHDDIGNKLQE